MNYIMHAEYTDTMAGEANYSWVRRVDVTIPDKARPAMVSRLIKRALGLTGVRGRVWQDGDQWEFRPYGMATVAFAHVAY
jgi:hypothetical protein